MDKDQGKIMSLLGVENRNGQRGNVKMSMASGGGASAETEIEPLSPEMTLSPNDGAALPVVRGNFLRSAKNADAKVPPHWPSLLPVEGYLSREFSRNPWFPFEEHTGIDIAGKQGSVIMAAGDGYVLYAGWHIEFGNVVILHHGEGLFSLYGHNDRVVVREREYVRRGATIALLGNSGRSSGPHLHFEVWQDGQAMDPRQYVLAFRSEPRIAAK
jgi:murein DD-endopeptidase MepM/ murein hydrolase activator NlpD